MTMLQDDQYVKQIGQFLRHCLVYFVVSSWEFSMPPPGNKALVDDDEGTMMVDTGIIELLFFGAIKQ